VRGLAVLLLWAVPVSGAAQGPPAQPPGPANAPPGGGPRRPAPPGKQVPRPGTLHRFWLREGDQIRYVEPGRDPQRVEALVVGSTDAQGITVVRNGEAAAIQFAGLTTLEVRGGQRHPWKGALVGALVGALSYVATGEAWDDSRSEEHRIRHGCWQTGIGLAAGALVGGLAWHPHWRTVDLSDVTPAAGPAPVSLMDLAPPAPARAGPPSLVTVRLRF
jgi:hypothetical protein